MVQVQPHTRFEKARIIGARALQIGMGAPVVLQGMSTLDPVKVAEEEYIAQVIPITVAKRGARVAPPSAAPTRPTRTRREATKAPAAP